MNLECLLMRYCSNVTAGVIQYLNQLPLRELDVGRCNIDDDCLAVISGITSIRVLNISDSRRITSSGLNCLVKLRLTKLTVRSYCRPQIHPTSTPPPVNKIWFFLLSNLFYTWKVSLTVTKVVPEGDFGPISTKNVVF